jgi:hypothetical protein
MTSASFGKIIKDALISCFNSIFRGEIKAFTARFFTGTIVVWINTSFPLENITGKDKPRAMSG